jgi:hypothetical protein
MRKWGILMLLVPVIGYGQVADDFSDGNFHQSPEWIGDAGHFEVTADKQLHLLSSGSDTSVLMTVNRRVDDTEWGFWVKLGFNTSVNNHARVYLAADTSVAGMGDALYLQIGGAQDSISLVNRTGVSEKILYSIKSYRTNHSTNLIRFRITHDQGDLWEVFLDTTGGRQYYSDGGFFHPTMVSPSFFGFYGRYTSSNAIKFWFDDVYVGPIVRDTVAPKIVFAGVTSDTTISLQFSEPVEASGASQTTHYNLKNYGSPSSAHRDFLDPSAVVLRWEELMPAGVVDSLLVRNLTDLSGNRMRDTSLAMVYYRPQPYDILIHEILADPDPLVGLPAEEFVELYNRSPYPVNLKGWSLKSGSYTKTFPQVVIPPGEYLILSKSIAYQPYGNILPLFSSSSTLANEGALLVLRDEKKHVIHTVTYDLQWFDGLYKEEGGWSLEMVDPANPCACEDNWKASGDPLGGTPGRVNSVHGEQKDEKPPAVEHAFLGDSLTLFVVMDEPLDSLSALPADSWRIFASDSLFYPDRIVPVNPDFQSVRLEVGHAFRRGTTYRLMVSPGVIDCAGNGADSAEATRFTYADTLKPNDLVINEILFDPEGYGSRYIEIYNRSEKVIDLSDLLISGDEEPQPVFSDAEPVVPSPRVIFPGGYFAVAPDPADVAKRYRVTDPKVVKKMEGFPGLGSDSGRISLLNRASLEVIDQVKYDESMHHPLITNSEAVALERNDPDMPSNYRENWHSAAETAGFGTPGYLNSQRYTHTADGLAVTISPEVFSPDNDGRDDIAGIILKGQESGGSVTIAIFDAQGRSVRWLAGQVYSGPESVFFWDGSTDAEKIASIGLYVVVVEVVNQKGKVLRAKKVVALAGRF